MITACERNHLPRRPLDDRINYLRSNLDAQIHADVIEVAQREVFHPSLFDASCAHCGAENTPLVVVIGADRAMGVCIPCKEKYT